MLTDQESGIIGKFLLFIYWGEILQYESQSEPERVQMKSNSIMAVAQIRVLVRIIKINTDLPNFNLTA